MSAAPFQTGDRVRWSGSVIQKKRDYWLGCGRASEKSAAKDWLDKAIAERGTVTKCEPGKYAAWVVDVRLDGETVDHNSLPYMWELAQP